MPDPILAAAVRDLTQVVDELRATVREQRALALPARCVDVAEAAQILGLTEAGVRKFVERRVIPYQKIGRCVRFRLSDLSAYLDETRVPALREE